MLPRVSEKCEIWVESRSGFRGHRRTGRKRLLNELQAKWRKLAAELAGLEAKFQA